VGTNAGAIADPATRKALARTIARAVFVFLGSVVLLLVGFTRFNGADRHQDDLVRDGEVVPGLILTVDSPIPGIDSATFSYPTEDGRKRQTLIVFNSYERGQKVTAYVSRTDSGDATLAGETPQTGFGWILTVTALIVGLVGIPIGARRLFRAARTWSVLRAHPWATWTMKAIYPKRRRLAVAAEGSPDEHLVRVDPSAARRLAHVERKSPILLAGSGRWFVLSPVDGRRIVALGRMDEPYERLGLINPGAAPDRFDTGEDDDEEKSDEPVKGGVWAAPDTRKDPLAGEVF
jgi:hypothetical protein